MQELIEWLEILDKNQQYTNSREVLLKAKSLLEIEKQQIKEAYKQGHFDGNDGFEPNTDYFPYERPY